MRMMEFQKEDHFRQLVDAVRKNRTLKYLDISKASLPYDAGPETCKALQLMFEENTTIEELDISGEYAHLDVARFGIGLNLALTGLKKNTSLRVLKIEHQRLGLQGANTLASVLENNETLLEVYCDNNEINLQSFTVLVNGLQKNKKLLHLPAMVRDREQCLERVRREIESHPQNPPGGCFWRSYKLRRQVDKPAPASAQQGNPHAATFSSPLASSTPLLASSTTPPHFARHDVQAVLQSLGQRWDIEVQRLQRYLVRNYNLAHGLADEYGNGADDDAMNDSRPTTAASLGTFLNQLSLQETSPTRNEESYAAEHNSKPEDDDYQDEKLTMKSIKIEKRQPSKSDTSLTIPSSRPPLLKYHSSSGGLQTPSAAPNLSVPTPSLPREATPGTSDNSIRTTKSNSNLSSCSTTSTSTGTGTRLSETASSLRGLLMARSTERREVKKDKAPMITLSQPPRLDWRLPNLET
ncbi:hypothetical protein ACJ72_02295 [Emergomyces africanus]|uniref:Uncharacterized protein n=1 Tax=Emergomyces africanus TaxID=1955775 RepID=A0A1B7P2U6_9EURO|nr:hypothetical protein ACJ72_02295 [Emergomyces africanus]